MTLSQLRRRIDALKRRFARELAIIKLRRIAEAVSDDWTPIRAPGTVRRHPAHRQSRLPAAHLRPPQQLPQQTPDARAKSPTPNPSSWNLLPWADNYRYRELPPLGTPLPGPGNDNHFPKRVRVRIVSKLPLPSRCVSLSRVNRTHRRRN